ncbi:hypothetical protein EVAR_46355_1 [Eumeta japonica]|uniref:Uncharacterized protein n=1 Tax=Eumeta variegata TaxID=151549 RepID=A0A4C1WY37_EUMVA|nr:hypothetical protein EVAR_46355_1 [Eumeta japonica]
MLTTNELTNEFLIRDKLKARSSYLGDYVKQSVSDSVTASATSASVEGSRGPESLHPRQGRLRNATAQRKTWKEGADAMASNPYLR